MESVIIGDDGIITIVHDKHSISRHTREELLHIHSAFVSVYPTRGSGQYPVKMHLSYGHCIEFRTSGKRGRKQYKPWPPINKYFQTHTHMGEWLFPLLERCIGNGVPLPRYISQWQLLQRVSTTNKLIYVGTIPTYSIGMSPAIILNIGEYNATPCNRVSVVSISEYTNGLICSYVALRFHNRVKFIDVKIDVKNDLILLPNHDNIHTTHTRYQLIKGLSDILSIDFDQIDECMEYVRTVRNNLGHMVKL